MSSISYYANILNLILLIIKSIVMKNMALWYRQFGLPKEVLQLESSLIYDDPRSDFLVKMIAAPINPSDLIPITGAYSHRVVPPLVAGYEGVGIVVKAKDPSLVGKKVLPLRGQGTWQNYVACDQRWAIPIPDFINDDLASRGYINPLAAYLMLTQCDLSDKNILITAAGSSCANILGQWAKKFGAARVVGIYRSKKHIPLLDNLGIIPVSIANNDKIVSYASDTDLVFDAVGGDLASLLLQSLPKNSQFISYGLLSGKLYQIDFNAVLPVRFHIRDYLPTITEIQWQNLFSEIWQLLAITQLSKVQHFDLTEWKNALTYFERSGRSAKPVLIMT